MKKSIIVLLIVIAIVFTGYLFINNEENQEVENEQNTDEYETVEASFDCEEGTIKAKFYNSEEDPYVELNLNDDREITADLVVSASGAKYESGEVVFWNKGNEAFLEEDGETTFDNCTTEDFNNSQNDEEINEELVGDWQWINTTYSDGEEVAPESDEFILTINEDGSMSATTDCNSVRGSFETEDSKIEFLSPATTKMHCEDSLEDEFLRVLNDSNTYLFEDGQLVITIKYDSGSAFFSPVE
ncbi:MAG: META domain-containing protein [Patescibacteria group bacterium]